MLTHSQKNQRVFSEQMMQHPLVLATSNNLKLCEIENVWAASECI